MCVETLRQWGSADYPVSYEYNDHNELIEMRTHRSASGTWHNFELPQGDPATWIRDPSTGIVIEKRDAAGKGAAYTYKYVEHGDTRHEYQYFPGSSLLHQTLARHTNALVLTRSLDYLRGTHIQRVSILPAAAPPAVYEYTYAPLGRRTYMTVPEARRWDYGYDAKSPVTAATFDP